MVGPDDRRIELRYRAPGFVPGVAVAAVAMALGLGIALGPWRRAASRNRRELPMSG